MQARGDLSIKTAGGWVSLIDDAHGAFLPVQDGMVGVEFQAAVDRGEQIAWAEAVALRLAAVASGGTDNAAPLIPPPLSKAAKRV